MAAASFGLTMSDENIEKAAITLQVSVIALLLTYFIKLFRLPSGVNKRECKFSNKDWQPLRDGLVSTATNS